MIYEQLVSIGNRLEKCNSIPELLDLHSELKCIDIHRYRSYYSEETFRYILDVCERITEHYVKAISAFGEIAEIGSILAMYGGE